MSFKDVVTMTDEEAELKKRGYTLGTTLGEGSYAKVKSSFSEKLQKRVALKIINRKNVPKDFRQKFLPRELQIIAIVDHPNIIKMYELMEFHNKVMNILFLMEIGENNS
jgi:serine kinase